MSISLCAGDDSGCGGGRKQQRGAPRGPQPTAGGYGQPAAQRQARWHP